MGWEAERYDALDAEAGLRVAVPDLGCRDAEN